jgi:cobalt-precorrin-5B (C1)-methyltransferase
MFRNLREGYTTGSCAAAAFKAAVLALRGEFPAAVTVLSPDRKEISIPVKEAEVLGDHKARGVVIKDAGDDMDCTNGMAVVVEIRPSQGKGLTLEAGEGVGRVTKPGLSVPVGEPAINPGPRRMMEWVYAEYLGPADGWTAVISIPGGEEKAKETLNPRLGVEGGLSILGTSGIVKPMSEEAYKRSLVPQLSVIREAGYPVAVLTPGRIGERGALRLGVPREALAETSNFIGYMLEEAVEAGFRQILLVGHPGKLIKVASGSFMTHNRSSDGRMETLAACAALLGADSELVRKILECSTTDAAYDLLEKAGLHDVYPLLAERAAVRSEQYVFHKAEVGVIFVAMNGDRMAESRKAEAMLERLKKQKG